MRDKVLAKFLHSPGALGALDFLLPWEFVLDQSCALVRGHYRPRPYFISNRILGKIAAKSNSVWADRSERLFRSGGHNSRCAAASFRKAFKRKEIPFVSRTGPGQRQRARLREGSQASKLMPQGISMPLCLTGSAKLRRNWWQHSRRQEYLQTLIWHQNFAPGS